MARRMLIDATHPAESRVVVLSGQRVEEFDYETATRAQLKGNIYLAKVTRVEPSLQAAFVEYGGNRHGFLPFSEIHPDYYRIPIADREALLAEEASQRREAQPRDEAGDELPESPLERAESTEVPEEPEGSEDPRSADELRAAEGAPDADAEAAGEGPGERMRDGAVEEIATETVVDTLGGDEEEEVAQRRRASLLRRYKIQEVIKRRQVMLVQVTKEERGSKGAALTTYLSLAGRYCVLMPNTAKGGGISRKISSAADRRRLKSVISEMDIPEGMAVIVRTAGSERTRAELKRDYEYLLRLWDDIRTKTLQSTAPSLIHEEANLIKRAIRDLYTREMDEVLVEGEEGYKAAKSFMKMLMPSHAKKVKLYEDSTVPLFHRQQVEGQIDAMYAMQVQLRSGGSIVINPTEALVAIDVNSGKATRERHIEETALKTNVEAAEEIARQLRLRDLAGLIVIDFIDMEDPRHNREVERRLKEAMRNDRARIQLGRISPFGLLELSRQRLRPSLFEWATTPCQTCHGTGFLRSPDSASLQFLRALTEEAIKRGGGRIEARVPTTVALYLLNEKRGHLFELEQRYGLTVLVRADDSLTAPQYALQRASSEALPRAETRPAEQRGQEAARPAMAPELEEAEEEEEQEEEPLAEAAEGRGGEEERRSRRGRRGGRRRRRETAPSEAAERRGEERTAAEGEPSEAPRTAGEQTPEEREEERRQPRRRGRRGGRRRGRRREDGGSAERPQLAGGEMPAETAEAAESQGMTADSQGMTEDESPPEPVSADSPEAKPERGSRRRGRRSGRSGGRDAPAAAPSEKEEAAAPQPERGEAPQAPSWEEAPAVAEPREPAQSPQEQREEAREPVLAHGTNGGGEPSEERAEAPQERQPQQEAESAGRPKRRGWWNRLLD